MPSIRKPMSTGGSRYLREFWERYNFDLVKALAAYNAGPQRVEQYGECRPFRETARLCGPHRARVQSQEDPPGKIARREEAKQKQVFPKPPAHPRTSKTAATAAPPNLSVDRSRIDRSHIDLFRR